MRKPVFLLTSILVILMVVSAIFILNQGNLTGNVIKDIAGESSDNSSIFAQEVVNYTSNPPQAFVVPNNSLNNSNLYEISNSSGSGSSRGSGRSSRGGRDNIPPDVNNSNSTSFRRNIRGIPPGLNLKINDSIVNINDSFEGRVRFRLEKQGVRISDFDINFSVDIDLSDVVSDADYNNKRVFLHSSKRLLENIKLYVPFSEEINYIVICSNASSLSEVHIGCGTNQNITKEEVLNISNQRITLSSDGLYYIISNITGTGVIGVNVTVINTSITPVSSPGTNNADAGFIKGINIQYGTGGTPTWQGYFGNVTGTLILSDASGSVLYNWSQSNPSGQVYITSNNTLSWGQLECFNFTATGTYQDDLSNVGGTSRYGTNVSMLEDEFNILSTDKDGVDETFSLIGFGAHRSFYAFNNLFSQGECQSTRIFSDLGYGEQSKFEEVLLYDPTTASIVFTSLLDNNVLGFDNKTHDFEAIVLEDGHGTDIDSTPYYFFFEIK